jgi:alkaline phosphatase
MSRLAIESLRKSPNGFALQIEGARVDHAAHPNDLAGLFYDQVAFEEAVKVAVEFALRDGETLVVITSDHGNANPGLNGVGREYGLSTGMFETIKGMRSSYQAMSNELRAASSVTELQSLFKVKLGLEVSSEHCQQLLDARNNNPLRGLTLYSFPTAHLAMILGSYTGVGWTSGAHTSDHTIVTAIGPGAELFHGLVKNTDVFHHLLAARDLRFTRNRQITREEAERMRQDGDTGATVEQHWL